MGSPTKSKKMDILKKKVEKCQKRGGVKIFWKRGNFSWEIRRYGFFDFFEVLRA